MEYKKHSIFILAVSVLLLVAVVCFNRIIDPLQLYGVNDQIGLFNDQRFQNSGLIRSYMTGRDTVFIGTSLSENFSTSGAFVEPDLRGLRLTMSGGYWQEHEVVCRAALATGKVRRVFWELRSSTYMHDAAKRFRSTKGFPKILYATGSAELIREGGYLLNPTISGLSMDLFVNGKFNDDTVGTYRQWINEHIEKGRFLQNNSSEKMREYQQGVVTARKTVSRNNEMQGLVFNNLDRLLALAALYPEVQFNLFLPPVSMISSASRWTPEKYPSYVRHIIAGVGKLPNVRLFAFTNLKGVVDNNANYEDAVHYGQAINDRILREMLDGQFEVTQADVEDHIDEFYDMISTWPFISDFSKATAYRPDQLILLKKAAERLGGEYLGMVAQ